MSLPTLDPLAITACFFQPEEPQLTKRRSPKPLVPINLFQLRKQSSSRKVSLSSDGQAPNSCKNPPTTRDSFQLKPVKKKQGSLHVLRTNASDSELPQKKSPTITQENIEQKQQHKRSNSAHLLKLNLEVESPEISKKNYVQQKNKTKQIEGISSLPDSKNLHFEVFQKSQKMRPQKPRNYFFGSVQTEASKDDQISLAFSKAKLPTLNFQDTNLLKYKFKGKTFLQSRAQINLVNKIFRE